MIQASVSEKNNHNLLLISNLSLKLQNLCPFLLLILGQSESAVSTDLQSTSLSQSEIVGARVSFCGVVNHRFRSLYRASQSESRVQASVMTGEIRIASSKSRFRLVKWARWYKESVSAIQSTPWPKHPFQQVNRIANPRVDLN